MRQSNLYIILFSVIMTVVIGGLLSGVSQVLKEPQKKSEELDTKKQILGAVLSAEELKSMDANEILAKYESSITSVVTNLAGDIVETQNGVPVIAENVDINKNFKMAPENRLFPVFKFHDEGNPDAVQAYVLPLFGAGLWDAIWGYLAIDTDLETIKGVKFAHAGETPGLGARITEGEVQERYQGKKLFNDGELVSVVMVKSENNDEAKLGPHKVDGMSGATITANGVNDMMRNYVGYYQNYFEKNVKQNGSMAVLAN